jgi:hypothetical protein
VLLQDHDRVIAVAVLCLFDEIAALRNDRLEPETRARLELSVADCRALIQAYCGRRDASDLAACSPSLTAA